MRADDERVSDREHEVRGLAGCERHGELGAGVPGWLAEFGAMRVQRGHSGIAEERARRVADVAELELEVRVAGRVVGWHAAPDAGAGRRARTRRRAGVCRRACRRRRGQRGRRQQDGRRRQAQAGGYPAPQLWGYLHDVLLRLVIPIFGWIVAPSSTPFAAIRLWDNRLCSPLSRRRARRARTGRADHSGLCNWIRDICGSFLNHSDNGAAITAGRTWRASATWTSSSEAAGCSSAS